VTRQIGGRGAHTPLLECAKHSVIVVTDAASLAALFLKFRSFFPLDTTLRSRAPGILQHAEQPAMGVGTRADRTVLRFSNHALRRML